MNKASDLFLLLLNLSQMRNRSKIMELFLESINAMFAPQIFQYIDQKSEGTILDFPIATRNSKYGHIVPKDSVPLSEKNQIFLHNASQMLAVILERLDFEETLKKERSSMSRLADERFLALQETVDQLQKSRNAYINLVEDLSREVIDRKRAEEEVRKMNRIFSSILENAGAIVSMLDANQNFIFWNKGAEKITGYSKEEVIGGKGVLETIYPDEEYRQRVAAIRQEVITGKPVDGLQLDVRTKTGEIRTISFYSRGVMDEHGSPDGMVNIGIDITEHRKTEEQLRQSMKMESVGRLAGGVAHDFNNMLTVILGYTQAAMDESDPSELLYQNLQEIEKAAQRSADLTRQLLAFARKQTVSPRELDLNKTVEGMLTLLQRLIGEDIDLAWQPGELPGPIKIDPSQIDQILANLCVNARDAISDTGKVTIETGAASFDKDHCTRHPGYVPGDYVMLAVSDNGCGMDKETLNKVFEPFFTTKEMGKGTGLGLAMIYGIVRQNEGFINVYSEPGQGTTFRIYLPLHAVKAASQAKADAAKPAARGEETILLVEDEPAILRLTRAMLERMGYMVLPAETPGEAIRLAQEHAGKIHLLMTDVVMPEMNGRDLAKNLLSLYPDLKRLFMSGYTADVIAHHGVLDKGVYFIHKPFTKKELSVKVREVLDQEFKII